MYTYRTAIICAEYCTTVIYMHFHLNKFPQFDNQYWYDNGLHQDFISSLINLLVRTALNTKPFLIIILLRFHVVMLATRQTMAHIKHFSPYLIVSLSHTDVWIYLILLIPTLWNQIPAETGSNSNGIFNEYT